MKNEKLLQAISKIDDELVYGAVKDTKAKKKKNIWVKWGAMAACLCLVVATATVVPTLLPGNKPAPNPDPENMIDRTEEPDVYPSHEIIPGFELDEPGEKTPPNNQNISLNTSDDVATDNTSENTLLSECNIHISMKNITFNDLGESISAAPKWYDPELYDSVVWNKEDIIAYYGNDLTPKYVPNGFIPTLGNSVVADKEGNIVLDTVWMGFYHELNDDGSPKLTDNVLAHKGFSITVSKIGLINDCVYLLPENEISVSDICGTLVTFGYRLMPYGPYDAETKEPSGYYDMYVAEFEHKDIEYQIVAEQMEAVEIVKVVSSIVCGDEVAVDE